MSAVTELPFNTNPPTSIAKIVEATPSLVLIDSEKFEEFYDDIAKEVRAHEPDLTTASGRKEIASLAYKVARTKTAIDDAGKRLTEDKRKEIKIVDEARKKVRDRLDALRDEARQPLTEWEAVEEKRIEQRTAEIDAIRSAAVVSASSTASEIEGRIANLEALSITPDTHQEFAKTAAYERKDTLAILRSNLDRIRKEEADRAELERLRAEAAERARVEAEQAAAREAERERAAAAQREAERKAQAEEAERQRLANVEADARRRAEEEAAAEKRRIEAAHAAELKRIEDERAAERRRADEEKRQAEAAALAKLQEDERRAADIEHRSTIMRAAKEALMTHVKLPEAKAKEIVLAIAAGNVPAVTIRF